MKSTVLQATNDTQMDIDQRVHMGWNELSKLILESYLKSCNVDNYVEVASHYKLKTVDIDYDSMFINHDNGDSIYVPSTYLYDIIL